jgi:catalase
VPADGDPAAYQHRELVARDVVSDALSMTNHVPGPIATRKVAILVAEQFDAAGVRILQRALAAEGAIARLVGPNIGPVAAGDGTTPSVEFSVLTTSSVLFDAVYVAGGEGAGMWVHEQDAVDFVRDAFKHCKAIGAAGSAIELLIAAGIPVGDAESADPADEATILSDKTTKAAAARFIAAMAEHRLWTRELELHLPL